MLVRLGTLPVQFIGSGEVRRQVYEDALLRAGALQRSQCAGAVEPMGDHAFRISRVKWQDRFRAERGHVVGHAFQ